MCSVTDSSLPSAEMLHMIVQVVLCMGHLPKAADGWGPEATVSGFDQLEKEVPFSNSHKDATQAIRGPGSTRLSFPVLHGCDQYQVLFYNKTKFTSSKILFNVHLMAWSCLGHICHDIFSLPGYSALVPSNINTATTQFRFILTIHPHSSFITASGGQWSS